MVLGKGYRAVVGYMPQTQGFYNDFSVYAFLMYISRIKGLKKEKAKERSFELMEAFNLQDKRRTRIDGLSGVEAVANKIYLLGNGEVIKSGTPGHLIQDIFDIIRKTGKGVVAMSFACFHVIDFVSIKDLIYLQFLISTSLH